MSAPTVAQLQNLYKSTLSAASRFASYNYRNHFVRRTDEVFKPFISSLESTSGRPDDGKIQAFYEEHSKELEVLKRAAEVNRAFEGPKLVVEHARVIEGGGGAGAEASMGGTSKQE